MKTTIEIADPLFRSARRLARQRGTTLRDVVESALRRELVAASTGKTQKFRLRDASFKGAGVQEGIDLADWSQIRALIYEGRGG